ncbi:hypothetical protein DUI87_28826 [Hirundo rustica rustica]|uniref:Uncharacterized protein n=1 Tax=Hirundo rustica rustica TaxID=333673 RepID=A0A3M0J747_HIRRU|nr:hypothetical protein DUI87_28826 [Hirundo rustica rustica]
MSSGGSLSTMQRLVEQLKLEAAVERIKMEDDYERIFKNTFHTAKFQWSLRQLQNSSSTVCKMPAKMPCLLVFLQGAIPSENPDPVLCSEIREGHWRIAFKHDMNNNSLSFTRRVSVFYVAETAS